MKKYKMKLLIEGILSTMLLIGCGQNTKMEKSESNQKEEVSLTLWGAQEDQELLANMVDSFQKNYEDQAKFKITIKAQTELECKETIFKNVNSAADVFAFADDQLMELAAGGIIEPVAESDKIKSENSEGSVNAASLNKNLYAYPMTADNGYFMFYNKKYFSEDDVTSLDKMLEIAARNNKKITMDWNSGWYLYSFFGNTGLSVGLNEDNITNYCDWNSKEGDIKGVDVGNAMLAIANNAGFLNTGDGGLLEGAKNGNVIAGVSGVWCANELEKVWGEDYAAAKLPTYTCAGKQVQMSSFAGYKMIGVNSYSKNKEWASKLAEWITNEENQNLRFTKRGQGPSNKKAAESKEVGQSPAIQALIAQSGSASLQRIGGNYWIPVATFGQNLADKKISSAQMQKAMDAMVKAITAKLID